MMTEIVRARMALTPYFNDIAERTAYHFKRRAIQYSLYGVDIDAGAVEIAKLRLWLSLVVDEEDVQQIKPLPNLDYKIVAGNSLLGVEKNLFNQGLFKRLEELKPKFFNESDRKNKAQFKTQIDDLIHDLTNGREVFDYEIYFSEVFHAKGGFDVLIGNPPYGFRQIHSASSKVYFKTRYASAHGSYENYFLFYEMSLLLVNRGGTHAFIAPVTWLTIPSAKSLRQFILNGYAISEICWLSEEVFENASVNTLISLIQRVETSCTRIKIFKTIAEFPLRPDIQQEIPQKQFCENDSYISIFSGAEDTAIVEKLRRISKPLAEFAEPCSGYNPYEIGAGIAPEGGAHTAKTVRDKPYHSDKKCGEQWKPEIVGRNLGRYSVKVAGDRWVKYGSWLAAQRDPDNFRGKRILVQEITGGRERRIVAAYFDGEIYHSRDIIPIKLQRENPHPYYLLGVINSWLISWYHQKCNPKAQKGLFPKVLVSDLKKLPVYPASKDEQQKMITLVDCIVTTKQRDAKADTSALEREIDDLVYALYGLTPDEITLIEAAR